MSEIQKSKIALTGLQWLEAFEGLKKALEGYVEHLQGHARSMADAHKLSVEYMRRADAIGQHSARIAVELIAQRTKTEDESEK